MNTPLHGSAAHRNRRRRGYLVRHKCCTRGRSRRNTAAADRNAIAVSHCGVFADRNTVRGATVDYRQGADCDAVGAQRLAVCQDGIGVKVFGASVVDRAQAGGQAGHVAVRGAQAARQTTDTTGRRVQTG